MFLVDITILAYVLLLCRAVLYTLCCTQARCTAGTDPCSVLPGSYVTLVLANVPAAAAAAIVQRTAAAAAAGDDADDVMSDAAAAAAGGAVGAGCAGQLPLVVFGLLQHEGKLSVLNFGLKKAAGYSESIRNKEELLFVTGVRR
jgi:pre-rRNA-processing protein TSR1